MSNNIDTVFDPPKPAIYHQSTHCGRSRGMHGVVKHSTIGGYYRFVYTCPLTHKPTTKSVKPSKIEFL